MQWLHHASGSLHHSVTHESQNEPVRQSLRLLLTLIKLFLLLVLADVLLDLDQAWHGELHSADKGVDHIHVWNSLHELLLSDW